MQFNDYIERKQREYGKSFDPSDLNKSFIPAFNSGERVTVDFGYEKKTGYYRCDNWMETCFPFDAY